MAGGRRQPALVRAVKAMMQALGGASVRLRIPVASASGIQRELGIVASAYQEVQVAPVVVRAAEETADARRNGHITQIEVLISPTALDAITPAVGVADGSTFLRNVEQIVYGERVFSVTDVSADRFAGVAYLYHVMAVASNQ